MLDIMYDIPSNDRVARVLVTLDTILGKATPVIIEGERKLVQSQASIHGQKGH